MMRKAPAVFGLTGWSGSGKTTLMAGLIPALRAMGLSVSTIKHAHKGFDIDRPGKDSFIHREAGAAEVLIASPQRWALLHEVRDAGEPTLEMLLAQLAPVDLVLVEGFKRDRHPKIEVWRAATGKPLIARDDDSIVAVATELDAPPPDCPVPLIDLNDADAVARLIAARSQVS
jgi:molybdopterin-guanine dinucleotide biosynthesis adapter protein